MYSNLFSQEKIDFKFIDSIPTSSEIIDFDAKYFLEENNKIKTDIFNFAKALNPTDEIIQTWSYSPFCTISFATKKGDYQLELFLGGLSIMTLPTGEKGYVLFDLTKLK